MPLHELWQQPELNKHLKGLTWQEAQDRFLAPHRGFKSQISNVHVQNETIVGPDGNRLPVRIYTPADSQDKAHPVLVYYHGGGYAFGNLDSHDEIVRKLCVRSGFLIVSVDYRLAPEHKFPAAHRDAYAAVSWVAAHASDFGGDHRRLAVGGDSAGGNLAVAACLQAQEKRRPHIAFQVLIYPATGGEERQKALKNPSFANTPFLNHDDMRIFEQWLLPEAEDPQLMHLRSPNLARDVSGLPPALILTAEFDPLRGEGEAFADKLQAAGVKVELKQYLSMPHGFIAVTTFLPLETGEQAISDCAEYMRQSVRPLPPFWDGTQHILGVLAATAVLAAATAAVRALLRRRQTQQCSRDKLFA